MTNNKNDKHHAALQQEHKDVARLLLDQNSRAAYTACQLAQTQYQGVTYAALAEELSAQIQSTCEGDIQATCKTLAAQATILDLLFQTLCSKAINSETQGDTFFDPTYLKLALKCQKQSAATNAMLQYLLPKNEKAANELSQFLEGKQS